MSNTVPPLNPPHVSRKIESIFGCQKVDMLSKFLSRHYERIHKTLKEIAKKRSDYVKKICCIQWGKILNGTELFLVYFKMIFVGFWFDVWTFDFLFEPHTYYWKWRFFTFDFWVFLIFWWFFITYGINEFLSRQIWISIEASIQALSSRILPYKKFV